MRRPAGRRRGEDVTASGLLAVLAPDLLPDEPPEEPDDARWGLEDARVDEARGELVLLLAEDPWDTEHDADPNRWGPEHDADDHPRAVVITLPLDGDGALRLLAREQRSPGHHVAFAL
ncbi:hypothetical protein AB0L40_05545 [Patulibacter sp. NPDC049589]|uniref:hypothetical protein n=1 Tax=Patulibacter sp. NPDC049589 TaxID=3154731 RepID=UPI0034158BA9